MENQVKNHELIKVQTPQDWESYHRIRREELFEARGRVGIYNLDHPDERLPENFPLLLKWNGESIGTVRLDVKDNKSAVIRLVAITKNEQGKGHGRELANLVEDFARKQGIKNLLVNAAPTAVGYYEKQGFIKDKWDETELTGISKDSVQMSKKLI